MKELLLSAAEEFGTPLYVYDLSRIASNYKKLTRAFGESTEIHFAMKALDNMSVLEELKHMGCGIDAVSIEELQIALRVGFTPANINFTPSGASISEYIWAHEQGVSVHVDNLGILEQLGNYKQGFPVALRFNPNVRSGGHAKLQVGADDSKFGLYPEEMPRAHEIISELGIEVRRIHVHVGSDIKTVEDFIVCWQQAFPIAERYKDTVRVIDLGGGFGVQYFPEDSVLDLDALGLRINALKREYELKVDREITLMLEPGKSIAGDSGFFLAEVTSMKHLAEIDIVYLNSGFNHFLRPMYYDAKHRVENLTAKPSEPKKSYKVVGYLCETDTFSDNVELPPTSPGDIICLHNAGAYSMTMSSNYNSRVRPAEVMIDNQALKLIRRRETLEDILSTQLQK